MTTKLWSLSLDGSHQLTMVWEMNMLLTISRLDMMKLKDQLKKTTVRPILQLFTESPTLKTERKNLAGLTHSDGPMMELLTILSCCTPDTTSLRDY